MRALHNNDSMFVIKRNGDKEEVSFDKVTRRIKNLSCDLKINAFVIAQKVCQEIYDGVLTTDLDELAAQTCAHLSTEHLDYGILASRICISNHQKNTSPSFSETISILYNHTDIHNKPTPLVSQKLYDIVMKNKVKLNTYIKYERDYNFDYFGFKTLEKAYLIKINDIVIERPQHMLMRVALGIHNDDFKDALNTYDLMSQQFFIHATPTLYNSGTPRPQLSSCFLLELYSDSISGIYKTLGDCAEISKWSGGIGVNIHKVRANNSKIRGTNGKSTGIIPMLRVFNNTARYVNQGGKRNGSFAMYLEPWHADIEDFLKLKKNHGNEEERARDLFYALWIPDLFMKRVEADENWTLMCPDECPGLSDCYGEEFEKLYLEYEQKNMGRKSINAQEIWFSILESQIETGQPYILYKDSCNKKSNQKNIGTIKCSNLCTEIVQYTSPEETAVCNLASVGLPKLINNNEFNFQKLYEITRVMTKNLNKVIDVNFYPIPEAERSNKRHRPIGIGVQGLADTFAKLGYPFDSDEAVKLNKEIFETIYFAAVTESMEIAKKRKELLTNYFKLLDKITVYTGENKDNYQPIQNLYKQEYLETYITNLQLHKDYHKIEDTCSEILRLNKIIKPIEEELLKFKEIGGAYATYKGSPVDKGILQYDMWGVTPSDRWDWKTLKEEIQKFGIRNSLLLSPMPTASTAQILGNNEAIEPYTSNIYSRRTLAGEFVIVNKHLVKDLMDIDIWNKDIKDQIILNRGSVQDIDIIPNEIKNKYKTVWEIKQKKLIDMSVDRGAFICQSQSLNLFVAEPTFNKLSSMHFYSWKQGLKTGIYYLRTRAVANAQQFTIDPNKVSKTSQQCTDEICTSCSG